MEGRKSMIAFIVMIIIFIIYLIQNWNYFDITDALTALFCGFSIGVIILILGGTLASATADTTKTLKYERELYVLKDNRKTYIYRHSNEQSIDVYSYLYMNKKKDIIKKNVECEYTKLHFTKGKPRIVKYEREIKNPILRFLFAGRSLDPEYIIYLPEDSIDKTFSIDLE